MFFRMKMGVAALALLFLLPQPGQACTGADCSSITAALVAKAGSGAPLSLLPFLGQKPVPQSEKPRRPRTSKAEKDSGQAQSPALPASDAFETAFRFMAVPPAYLGIAEPRVTIVSEHEVNHIDLAADRVQIVDHGEVNEIDLAVERITRVAAQDLRNSDADSGGDDDLFNRILMTFAGALAAASAMRIFIA